MARRSSRPRVVVGLQGVQMPANALRGIGRWATEFCLALVDNRPDLVAAVAVDPVLPLPAVINRLPLTVPVLRSDEAPPVASDERIVFHALSVIEDLAVDRLWPPWAREPQVAFVPTVYDMIPARYPDEYFRGPGRHLLESRYQLVRQADAVITISTTTATDVEDHLQIDARRIHVVYGAVGAQFDVHPFGPGGAAAELNSVVDVGSEFVLSIGNVDPRKNLDRLLRAYAVLPPTLRGRHKLVITCSQGGSTVERLRGAAEELGIAETTVVLPYVDDPTMVLLYQACGVMVFPSLFEGLGLPIVEAMRCGAVAIASDVSSMREVLRDPTARFDPYSVPDMSAAIRRALAEGEFATRRRAAAVGEASRFSGADAAARAAAAYECAVGVRL